MSGVTASSTLTVVLTPYTTAEPAASATASKVQPCNRPANIRTSNGFISDKGSAHGWGISGTKKPRKPGPFGGVAMIAPLTCSGPDSSFFGGDGDSNCYPVLWSAFGPQQSLAPIKWLITGSHDTSNTRIAVLCPWGYGDRSIRFPSTESLRQIHDEVSHRHIGPHPVRCTAKVRLDRRWP